ncbi:putative purine-cytosine permease YxlA [Sphaerisporangium krabiense]|uniref:NCS1 family nucleobase:cation symporter-1 n=1 Tax=Sphaerisporangium krabiense TaxID=763782 RepID=A0A7W8Z270_9ACTN|nr:cytosine permease [Sphaerisporangium krabiense]MBB5626082.1 NCS1 family nucleobase:cation symporter-1 [Sphaerisporangium krabiense]GII64886.1 putative purine-cytosine permease YxlA [Sphaerisporangium krabiense]
MSEGKSRGVEVHHIDVVAPSERHGKARDLFAVWCSANLSIGQFVFGALAVIVGNNLLWAVIALVVGNVVGGAFMALHSAQGSRLGVPQLIQSRGQFGYYGALLPVVLAALLYGGFFVVTAIIGGQALTAAVPAATPGVATVLVSLISIGLALIGYRVIHLAARLAVWPLSISVLIVAVASIRHGGLDWSLGGFSWGPFLTAIGLVATFLLTYAPYVSDYSRYLPEDTPARSTFGWTFLGATTGYFAAGLVGAFLAVQFKDLDSMAAVRAVLGDGPLTFVVLIVGAAAIGGNNALNLYGGMLNLITAVSSAVKVKASVTFRVVMLLPTFLIGLAVAMWASDNFVTNLSNFLSFLMLGFVPWGAVNLIDYYLVRHGDYDVNAFFEPRGPYYEDSATWTWKGIAWKAILSYVVGVLASIPLVGNTWYTGPLSEALGGADLSWIPGTVVTGAVYLLLMGRRSARRPRHVLDRV